MSNTGEVIGCAKVTSHNTINCKGQLKFSVRGKKGNYLVRYFT